MGLRNNKMVKAIPLLDLAGMITAYYAYHVESKLHDPFYKPVCETSWGSCATVFRSSYAHLVSHFGIVPPGHALDLSLAESGDLDPVPSYAEGHILSGGGGSRGVPLHPTRSSPPSSPYPYP